MKHTFLLLSLGFLCPTVVLADDSPTRVPNPFYAMDTSFTNRGLTPAQQWDLLKELGFPGFAWTERPVNEVIKTLADVKQKGLKMFTIYCAASVTQKGELTYSKELPRLMEALQGQETIIWLHIGGQGPAFNSLKGDEPVVKSLASWPIRRRPTNCGLPSILTWANGPLVSATPPLWPR